MEAVGLQQWAARPERPLESEEEYSTLWLHKENQAQEHAMLQLPSSSMSKERSKFLKLVPSPTTKYPAALAEFTVHHFPTKYTPACWTTEKDFGLVPNTPPHFKPINLPELKDLLLYLQDKEVSMGEDCFPIEFERERKGSGKATTCEHSAVCGWRKEHQSKA